MVDSERQPAASSVAGVAVAARTVLVGPLWSNRHGATPLGVV